MFKHYNYLGFNTPYFYKSENEFIIKENFSEIYDEYPLDKSFDVTAIIEILNKNYILGDRSIITGIERTPWMARLNMNSLQWQFAEVPKHSENEISEEEIARELFERISLEILEYVGESANIGILLSGGMDSRIVAGTLDTLIKTDKLDNVNVTALTWGNENSRDVQYAKEIAKRLGWRWKHYIVTANDLLNNIEEAAINGCEYSPIHLHALPQIRDDKELNLDLILAGSYGDSIGRAEYSGKKVSTLKSISSGFNNVGGLLKDKIYKKFSKEYLKDIQRYHVIFPKEKLYQQYEQDYQLHYMRRMLNPCINILYEKAKVHQVFTHPQVYGYMWSINPTKRNDFVYKYMFSLFKTNITDIPWARTGLPYGQTSGTPDDLDKKHHSYSEFVRNSLYEHIKSLALSNHIQNLGIFNMLSIKVNLHLIKNVPHMSHFYEERLLWIASLAKFINLYKLDVRFDTRININDVANSLLYGPSQFSIRSLKEYLAKLR